MIKQAVRITWTTLVGRNNCFSVETKDKKSYRIVNFYLETMEELLKKGLKWPVQIKVLGPWVAVVHDHRIADEHYRTDFCESCCPRSLLPIQQQLRREREIRRGDLTVKEVVICGRKVILESRKIKPVTRKLKAKWTVSAAKDLICVHNKKAEKVLVSGLTKAVRAKMKKSRRVK